MSRAISDKAYAECRIVKSSTYDLFVDLKFGHLQTQWNADTMYKLCAGFAMARHERFPDMPSSSQEDTSPDSSALRHTEQAERRNIAPDTVLAPLAEASPNWVVKVIWRGFSLVLNRTHHSQDAMLHVIDFTVRDGGVSAERQQSRMTVIGRLDDICVTYQGLEDRDRPPTCLLEKNVDDSSRCLVQEASSSRPDFLRHPCEDRAVLFTCCFCNRN